jgi:hypothetical protein
MSEDAGRCLVTAMLTPICGRSQMPRAFPSPVIPDGTVSLFPKEHVVVFS